MQKVQRKINSLRYLAFAAIIIVSFAACALTSRPAPADNNAVLFKSNAPLSGEAKVVNDAVTSICKGNFDSAGKLIEEKIGTDPNKLDIQPKELLEIVSDYDNINQQRKVFRDKAYAEKLAKLDKYRKLSDTNDPNEPNDLTVVLSAISDITELATPKQKEEVLSEPYVKQVIQDSIDKAAGFELKGKWIDAYTNCYLWLVSVDPNNENYKKYAQQIYDKAVIAASLEDSPCETRTERYEGVKKEMFMRAIVYLEQKYVSKPDYSLMTEKAIEQCKLLGEVMEFPPEDFLKTIEQKEPLADYKKSLTAWSGSLDAMLSEAKKRSKGVTLEIFLDIFTKVLILNESTVRLPEQLLITQFADASLSALDPYTVIVWPRQVNDFEKMMTNEFSGIGVEISKPAGSLTVASLLPDTPAYKSGLDAGDVIEAVDGIETKDMPLTCAVRKITGQKGTKVTLKIRRPGEKETKDIVITRNTIVVPTIRGWQRSEAGQWDYMVDKQNKIGYIRLTSFSGESSADMERTLNVLETDGMKGLILDLRYNSGGLLTSALDICDKFISEGLIVSRVPRPGDITSFEEAHKKGTHPNYPLVILTNSSSASASEIVAGALSDKAHERATLVGTRTHGKGSVQGITNINGDSAQLKFTMAHYHLPSGQKVESREAVMKEGRRDWGVGPDVQVDLISDEVRKMLEVQKDNDVLFQADHETVKDEVKKHTLRETLEADRQLAVGLLVVKSKLIQDEVVSKAK